MKMGVPFYTIGVNIDNMPKTMQCQVVGQPPTLQDIDITPESTVRHFQTWQFLGTVDSLPTIIKNNVNIYLCIGNINGVFYIVAGNANSSPAHWIFTRNLENNKYKISTNINGTVYNIYLNYNDIILLDTKNYTEFDIVLHPSVSADL